MKLHILGILSRFNNQTHITQIEFFRYNSVTNLEK